MERANQNIILAIAGDCTDACIGFVFFMFFESVNLEFACSVKKTATFLTYKIAFTLQTREIGAFYPLFASLTPI